MVKLKKVSIMPLAQILCVFQAVIGFILGVIVAIGSLAGQEDDGLWSLGVWSILVFPIINAGLGFLTGMFLACGYNLIAKWFGGIEIELEDN